MDKKHSGKTLGVLELKSKDDYRFFLEADRVALGMRGEPKILGDDVWKFQRLLRKTEYYLNCRTDILGKLYLKFLHYQIYKMSMRMGFYIPPNTCGPGLSIAQFFGPIIISPYSTLGANCRISTGVVIGGSSKSMYADKRGFPKIGNHVFIGPHVVIALGE